MIEQKNGVVYYRNTPIYGPFLPESNRIIYFECINNNCLAGSHTMLNNKIGPEIQKNNFELRPHESAPRIGEFIGFKKCPDCNKLTLVRS